MWYAAPLGNLLIVNAPADLTGPNNELLTEMARLNEECAIPTHMGFSFNTENVVNEVAACTNIVMQYQSDIATGKLNSQEEMCIRDRGPLYRRRGARISVIVSASFKTWPDRGRSSG